MQDYSDISYLQQSMAQRASLEFDDADAPSLSEVSGYSNCGYFDINNQFGTQFEDFDARIGGAGSYPDLEQEQQDSTCCGPYFIDVGRTQFGTSSERPAQFVIPGRGRPDLAEHIVEDLPGLSSHTPSVSDTSGDAQTPPSCPPAGELLPPMKNGYERPSVAHRRDQECFCNYGGCNNKKFSRRENLDRHNRTKHGFEGDRHICCYCEKVSHARLDRARSHWRNIHERQGLPFQPRIERRGMTPRV